VSVHIRQRASTTSSRNQSAAISSYSRDHSGSAVNGLKWIVARPSAS